MKLLVLIFLGRFELMIFDFLLVLGFELLILYFEFFLVLEILDFDLVWINFLSRLFFDWELIEILFCWFWILGVIVNWVFFFDLKVGFFEINLLLINRLDKLLVWYFVFKDR